jgi:hypothetical protein
MEKAMLYVRVVIAGALVLTMVGAAAAQSDDTSSTAAPGKPVTLLQLLLKPASSEPAQDGTTTTAAQAAPEQAQPDSKAHTRVAHRHRSARKYAHRKALDDAAAAESPAPDSAAATTAPAPDATANTQAAPDQSNMSAVVVDGHTVQIASPDQVNVMDMAAGDTLAAPPQAVDAPQQAAIADPPQAADPQQQPVTLSLRPASMEEQPATIDQKPETTQPVVAMAAMTQQDDSNDKSRDLWYEKLLMTLSGAFVASSVAWLLIGSAPPRRSEPMLTYETERMTR